MEPKFPYRHVADDLRAKIQSGELTGKLPTRAQLADEYGVTDMTIGRAVQVLRDEGLIKTYRGLGMWVA
jgi:DNA-binding GntR family transcriptional regulator